MTDKSIIAQTTETADDDRREFLARAGKVAVTAPAAALLLAASSRSAIAQAASNNPNGGTPSDIRLKEDIQRVGVAAHGLPIYRFRYRGQDGVYEGVMAQDVLTVMPEAVILDANGMMRVDYGKLGVPFRRLH